MDEPGFSERPSVLGSADLPNASRTTIAVVLGVCVAAGLLLGFLIAITLGHRIDRPDQPIAAERKPVAAAPVAARLPPPADPRLASTPLRGNPALAFGPDDYPVEALRRSEQGRVVARLSVDATGRPVRCTVATSSRSRSLDETTCRIALDKVRYQPARDQLGRVIPATATLPVRWVLPQESPAMRR